ncbi:hypothetical protein BT63DRAFT_426310 [Microthyrium microscopicum]|uniref:Uncharacterized protein n=1 Tax=Microthyrium microscopicum TaxID=703497 RepID=A0A6A6U768_9PEZI|nr:hypothetical protein BT63DRAFT_426310 [Microthyrium microscopicum]
MEDAVQQMEFTLEQQMNLQQPLRLPNTIQSGTSDQREADEPQSFRDARPIPGRLSRHSRAASIKRATPEGEEHQPHTDVVPASSVNKPAPSSWPFALQTDFDHFLWRSKDGQFKLAVLSPKKSSSSTDSKIFQLFAKRLYTIHESKRIIQDHEKMQDRYLWSGFHRTPKLLDRVKPADLDEIDVEGITRPKDSHKWALTYKQVNESGDVLKQLTHSTDKLSAYGFDLLDSKFQLPKYYPLGRDSPAFGMPLHTGYLHLFGNAWLSTVTAESAYQQDTLRQQLAGHQGSELKIVHFWDHPKGTAGNVKDKSLYIVPDFRDPEAMWTPPGNASQHIKYPISRGLPKE